MYTVDWHLVRDHCEVGYLVGGMGHNLSSNRTERDSILEYFRRGWDDQPRRLFDWSQYVEENFDQVIEEEGENCTWDKDHWYCKDCLIEFLRSRFRKWWTAKRREGAYYSALQFESDFR